MRWAFSDESRRGNQLVMAAAVVETHDVAAVRAELRRFLRANQRRVHMAKESPARRRQFSYLICALPIKPRAFTTTIGRRSMPAAREVLLSAMTIDLLQAGVESWVIEAIGHVQEAAIAESSLTWSTARRSRPNWSTTTGPHTANRCCGQPTPSPGSRATHALQRCRRPTFPKRATPGCSPSGELTGCTSRRYCDEQVQYGNQTRHLQRRTPRPPTG